MKLFIHWIGLVRVNGRLEFPQADRLTDRLTETKDCATASVRMSRRRVMERAAAGSQNEKVFFSFDVDEECATQWICFHPATKFGVQNDSGRSSTSFSNGKVADIPAGVGKCGQANERTCYNFCPLWQWPTSEERAQTAIS